MLSLFLLLSKMKFSLILLASVCFAVADGTSNPLIFQSSYLGTDGLPRGFCNWLVPGKMMLGRYPHKIPSITKSGSPTVAEAREHLTKVIGAGVNTFICLQDEIPAQDDDASWPSNGVYIPAKLEDTRNTDNPQGFIRYLDDAVKIAAQLGKPKPRFIYHPIVDMDTPDFTGLHRFLSEVISSMEDQGAVCYMHCWAGRGRAGTVGASLAVQMEGQGGDDAAERALALVQRGFDTRPRAEGEGAFSPETEAQRKFVRSFANSILGRGNVLRPRV